MTDVAAEPGAGPARVQVRGTVLTVRRVDAYYAMTVVAPGIAAKFRPGQFVAVAVGGQETSMLLRRAFSIHDVRPDHGGTVEFVFAVVGPGTQWLSERRTRDMVDIAGPLGRPFPLPRDPVSCLLVTDVLGQVIHEGRTDVIYACGPMGMLRQATAVARRYDIPAQVLVEEHMACGTGVCMTCVLPVVGEDGVTRMVRSCIDGPVFRGDQVRWDDVGTVPFDALGAPGWKPRRPAGPRPPTNGR